MDPGELDVNIHPTKQEVKFTSNSDILGLISNIIHERLFPSLNIPKFEEKETIKEDIPVLYEKSNSAGVIIRDYTGVSLVDDATDTDEIKKVELPSKKITENNHNDYKKTITDNVLDDNNFLREINEDVLYEDDDTNNIKEILPEIRPIGIVFGTYIIGENNILNKLFFIDQHAAHERILYEKFRAEYNREAINIQQLITPEILDLTMKEFSLFTENIEFFRKLGFEVEEFGTTSIAIRGVPFLFGKPNIKNLFMDLLDNVDKDLKSSYDTRLDKLMKLACTSAIKSGDKISDIEIKSLLSDLSKCENPYSCPHGRPTIIEIPKNYIEKKFLRII